MQLLQCCTDARHEPVLQIAEDLPQVVQQLQLIEFICRDGIRSVK